MTVHTLCMTIVAPILALNLTVGVMAGRIQIMKVGIGNQRTVGFPGIHVFMIFFLVLFLANKRLVSHKL
jgi:hypothetical protein